MQIRIIANEGRVVSRVRARHPHAAPHTWEATEGVCLAALAEGGGGRHGDTVEVWLDARSLAAIDTIRRGRAADEAAILEDAARYRNACAAVNAARRAHRRAPTPDTAAALASACAERCSAEVALTLTARAGTAGRMPDDRPDPPPPEPGDRAALDAYVPPDPLLEIDRATMARLGDLADLRREDESAAVAAAVAAFHAAAFGDPEPRPGGNPPGAGPDPSPQPADRVPDQPKETTPCASP